MSLFPQWTMFKTHCKSNEDLKLSWMNISQQFLCMVGGLHLCLNESSYSLCLTIEYSCALKVPKYLSLVTYFKQHDVVNIVKSCIIVRTVLIILVSIMIYIDYIINTDCTKPQNKILNKFRCTKIYFWPLFGVGIPVTWKFCYWSTWTWLNCASLCHCTRTIWIFIANSSN